MNLMADLLQVNKMRNDALKDEQDNILSSDNSRGEDGDSKIHFLINYKRKGKLSTDRMRDVTSNTGSLVSTETVE